MIFSYDDSTWLAHYTNIPVRPPLKAMHEHRFAPGICVKSRKFVPPEKAIVNFGGPIVLGIIAEMNEDINTVVIVGHGSRESESEIFTWTGTFQELKQWWIGD